MKKKAAKTKPTKTNTVIVILPAFSAAAPAVKFLEFGLTLKVALGSGTLRCEHKNTHGSSDQTEQTDDTKLILSNQVEASPLIGHHDGWPVALGRHPATSTLWFGGQSLSRSCFVHHRALRGLTRQ